MIADNNKPSEAMLDRLTIICPTYNRPHMLRRTLRYYAQINFTSRIIIADSSEPGAAELVRCYIKEIEDQLIIEYLPMPTSTDYGKKLYEAALLVDTPFLIVMPDDDLLIKPGAIAVLSYLEGNPDAVSAYGNRLSISAVSARKESPHEWVKLFPYFSLSLEQDDPIDRIRRLPVPSWWQFPYAVYRSAAFAASVEIISDKNYTQFTEFFLYSAVLAHGKWVKIDCLFALCNTDSHYYTARDRNSFPFYWGTSGSIISQITRPFWSEHVSDLSKRLAYILSGIEPRLRSDELSKLLLVIYMSINNKYLDQGGLSHSLFSESQSFLRALNNIRIRVNKIFWMLILYDREGGVNAWANLIFSVGKEVSTGRLFRVILRCMKFSCLKKVFTNLKRVGSLDYELDELLRPGSRFSQDFQDAFRVWSDDPCPDVYVPELERGHDTKAIR